MSHCSTSYLAAVPAGRKRPVLPARYSRIAPLSNSEIGSPFESHRRFQLYSRSSACSSMPLGRFALRGRMDRIRGYAAATRVIPDALLHRPP
jgi:hypothetical protein